MIKVYVYFNIAENKLKYCSFVFINNNIVLGFGHGWFIDIKKLIKSKCDKGSVAVLVIGNQHKDVQDKQTGTLRTSKAFHAW